MVHVRETRPFASEIKFLIAPALAPRLLEWARTHLGPDPHGAGRFDDQYHTSTLYFDTSALDVYLRHGSFGRAKYRARRYGTGEVAFLERKLRQPGVLIKRRTMVPLGELGCLCEGERAGDWRAEWFHRRLKVRSLRPVCQVSYDRTARQIATADGTARFTLDSHLRALALGEPCFSSAPGVAFGRDGLILELKYRMQLPAVFRRLVEEFALRPETASKYRLAMAALGCAAPAGERWAVCGPDPSYA